jgi:hypothetical protein
LYTRAEYGFGFSTAAAPATIDPATKFPAKWEIAGIGVVVFGADAAAADKELLRRVALLRVALLRVALLRVALLRREADALRAAATADEPARTFATALPMCWSGAFAEFGDKSLLLFTAGGAGVVPRAGRVGNACAGDACTGCAGGNRRALVNGAVGANFPGGAPT